MKGIIMAGGEGSRLRPLTAGIPKPMVPVAGQPAIKHIIEHLYKYNVKDIAITLFYLPHKIKEYVEQEYGSKIKFYIEDKPLGTAGSVKNAKDFLNDTFIVMSGDVITDVNVKEVYEFHKRNGAKVTLILTKVDVPLEYGVVIIDEKGRIKKFLEKPSWGEVFSDTVNTGIYIIEPEILEFIPQGKSFDFSKDLFPYLLQNNIPMYGYITEGYWCDIGNTAQYISSHFDILKGAVDLGYKEILLKEGIMMGENVKISPNAIIIPPVIIGDNSVIEENTVVGPNVIVGRSNHIKQGSTLKNSILWDDVIVGQNSELRGCVVCKNVTIFNNVRIFENSVIGENCNLRAFSEIKPDVKVWPDKTVEEGFVVIKDIVWGNGKKQLFFGERGIKGVFNYDITPEMAVEVGEAFGNVFTGNIIVGHDGDFVSKFVSNLISYGLLSSGCDVLYADYAFLPAIRYGIRKNKLEGGVYVETEEPDKLRVLFMDKNGCDIDRNAEKKIENKLKIYDIKRISRENLKDLKKISVQQDYIDNLFSQRKDYLKIKVKPYNEETKQILEGIGKSKFFNITEKDYDVGLIFSKNGEQIRLYDEKGREFDDDELYYMRMLLAEKEGVKSFVIPFNSSNFLTEFAKEFSIEPLKSKISHKDRMKKIIETEGVIKDRVSQFSLSFDGLSFFLKLLDYLDETRTKLSYIKDKFPLRYKINKSIKCEWKDKGKIIRMLFEKADEKVTEFVDGLKFNHGDSWVLVLPDSELPACNIYVEAPTMEKAYQLFSQYEKEVRNILNSEDEK
ncbi:putative mannose-1-phosphate guanyltransferase Mpg [Thermoanaerobacter kivui]|uniref:Putative mannose-1-phosphate guanyltransferase Mpg n=1 Tax=Thermoanaerobacter kivui TaxID=2325 RepID=A0A097AT43_THEKI|nr:sugar phosphate nucleotidyltransferase [Thermoanaerobacter kivui]AIS52986.1 putative mannose-1-phosphate guanyltransferase Mpg [Thermoanaerobacter kivui]